MRFERVLRMVKGAQKRGPKKVGGRVRKGPENSWICSIISDVFYRWKKACFAQFCITWIFGRNLHILPSLGLFCLMLQSTSQKKRQNWRKNGPKMGKKGGQKGPKMGLKRPDKDPKRGQSDTKTPKWCQMIPKWPRIDPKMVQNHPKMTPF